MQSTTFYVQAEGADGVTPRTAVPVTVEPALAANDIEGTQSICLGDAPLDLRGLLPTGGSGMYVYLWEISTDGISFFPAPGTNDYRNYSPGSISHTSWFRRTVSSSAAGCESQSNVVRIMVLPPLANNELVAPPPVCPGDEPREIAGSAPTGGNGTYTFQWQVQQVDGSYMDAPDGKLQYYQPRVMAVSARYRRLVQSEGCVSISEPVEVSVKPAPERPVLLQNGNEVTSSVSGTAYEWVFEGALLANATGQTVSNAAPGAYMVRVLNEAGCFSPYSDSLLVSPQPMGIMEKAAKNVLKLVPNPSKRNVALVLDQAWPHAQVVVVNTLGTVVYRAYFPLLTPEQELDIAALPAGTYSVQVQTKEKFALQRLLIIR